MKRLTAADRRTIIRLLDYVAQMSEVEIECHTKPDGSEHKPYAQIVRRARERWRKAQAAMRLLEGQA